MYPSRSCGEMICYRAARRPNFRYHRFNWNSSGNLSTPLAGKTLPVKKANLVSSVQRGTMAGSQLPLKQRQLTIANRGLMFSALYQTMRKQRPIFRLLIAKASAEKRNGSNLPYSYFLSYPSSSGDVLQRFVCLEKFYPQSLLP